ncbi:terminase small subunit [Psychrobacter glacincola]|uniref:terminase small subunit n=1 Tax=Psychrobacter glacincola TaxID=56810 RepID=UPI0039B08FA4
MSNDTPNSVVSEEDIPLEPRQQLFVDEYIVDFNATRAAKAAGYSENSAASIGSENLTKPNIDMAVDKAIADRRKRLRIDADTVLCKWWQIANADYNELSSVRRVACGWCYGGALTEDDEYETPVVDISQEPDADCIKCRGEGSPHVHIADTSKLSPTGRLLYQGAENTKFGIKVNVADRMKALDNVARHLGMFKDTVNHVSEDGSMTPTVNNFNGDAQAASQAYQDIMGGK